MHIQQAEVCTFTCGEVLELIECGILKGEKKMNEMTTFTNSEFGAVRTMTIDGEPWFVGKDVASILGYANSRDALAKRVDDEDKGVANCDSLGGKQEAIVINESGLYSLVLSSKLPTAKRFKRWVTGEVLPALRKHGIYAADEILNDPDLAIKALTALKEERERRRELERTNLEQAAQLIEMQPKAAYYDVILNCRNAISMTVIAKDYGKSARWMNERLHELGVQYRQGSVWVLYQKYAGLGYTASKTSSYCRSDGSQGSTVHTYWTQKGRMFIYDLMKKINIKPLIEIN